MRFKLKKIIYSLLLILSFYSCLTPNYLITTEPIVRNIFSDEENLPSKIIFNEEYYNQTTNVFFVISNYTKDYSRLVEYSTENENTINIIYETSDAERIYEYSNNKNYIVFSTLINESDNKYHDLFYYDIYKKKLFKINNYKINKNPVIYPTKIKVGTNFISWVEQDFDQRVSRIMVYNIDNEYTEVLDESKFNNNNNFPISIFFTDIDRNYIIYDKCNDKNMVELILYDYLNKELKKIFDSNYKTKLHYNGSLNYKNQKVVFYAQTESGDIVYLYDIKRDKYEKLVGFYPHSVIYNDKIKLIRDEFYYTTQKNVSGLIKDHYAVETYNLKSYKMRKEKEYFDIYKSDNYNVFLRFDKEIDVRKIHFEIYEN